MKLQPDKSNSLTINAYGPGWIEVNAQRFTSSLVVSSLAGSSPQGWEVKRFEDLRPSDFEIEFQLEDDTGALIDVTGILDITVELIHIPTSRSMVTYIMAQLTLDPADDTIHVFVEHTDNDNKKLGKYIMKVWWEIADANFSGGTRETIDQIIVTNLMK
jgi:hypothetical protein